MHIGFCCHSYLISDSLTHAALFGVLAVLAPQQISSLRVSALQEFLLMLVRATYEHWRSSLSLPAPGTVCQ